MGSSNGELGLRSVLNHGIARMPGAPRAARAGGRRGPGAVGARHRHHSIRQPAALCGIVGLKPTYGSVSRYGMIAFASTLDHAGPLTRDVTDADLLLRHMVGHDPCDATSLEFPHEIELPSAERLDGTRLGVPAELTGSAAGAGASGAEGVGGLAGEGIEAGVLDAFRAALEHAVELGAEIVESVRLPHAPHALSAYYVLAPAEASSNLARFDGVRYGLRAEGAEDLLEMYERTRHDGFGAEVKRRIMLGTYVLSAGYYDAYYGRAQRVARTRSSRTSRAPSSRSTSSSHRPPERRVRAWRQDGRSAADVPERLLHGADVARRDPGDLDSVRAQRRAAGRVAARRACVQREPTARRLARAGAGVRLRRERGACRRLEAVIGLEIHVQLKTRTKMFCGCELSFGEPENTRTCPVCLGLPGALPVANAQAIHFGLTIGLALGSELAPTSVFHRKNYFYPDLPKGYQISQYDRPLCKGGSLGEVRIHRVHLEDDAAKLTHVGESGRIHGSRESVVDFNRGGTPLAEIVTEPDLRSAEQASEWLKLLRTTLRQLGVSDVNMEEGSLRCDANISLRPAGSQELGTKTELKNMNSFRFIEQDPGLRSPAREGILAGGGTVVQETLHYDPASGAITTLRSKEEAHDYRYFPEPDLVPVRIDEQMLARAQASLGELPADRAQRYEHELGLSADSARLLAFRAELGDYFEAALAVQVDPPAPAPAQALANWIAGDLLSRLPEDGDPAVTGGTRRSGRARGARGGETDQRRRGPAGARQARGRGRRAAEIVRAEGLEAIGAGDELGEVVAAALAANPDAAQRIREGNAKAIGPIVGHVMRETKGRADGGEVTRLVHEQLGV